MKSLIKLVVLSSALVFVGICSAQTASKKQPESAAKAPEAVPPAAPGALFPSVVARVDGEPIPGRELERLVKAELIEIGSPDWKNLRQEYRGELVLKHLANLVNSRLIMAKATASGVTATDAEVAAEMKKIADGFQSDAEMNMALAAQMTDRASLEKDLRKSLVMSKYVEENVNKKVAVAPEEVTKYYTSHPAEFQHPDIVRASHILIRPAGNADEQDRLAKEKAEALLARIKKGEDFAKLAKENSTDGSASAGGDLGFFPKDNQMAPEFSAAAFALPVGGLDIVKTAFGYHVIKVTEKKKEGLLTLEEVKANLTEALKQQKAQEAMDKLVTELRSKAKIELLVTASQLVSQ